METAVALLVAQLDRSFPRIRRKLNELTDEEHFWEPVPGCWTVHRRRPEDVVWGPGIHRFVNGKGEWVFDYAVPDLDPPPFTTIAWRLEHVGGINLMYHEHVFGQGRLDWDDLEIPHTAAAAVAKWSETYMLYRDALADCRDADLERVVAAPWGDTRSVLEWSVVLLEENVHHTAEVGVLRDLYREARRSGQLRLPGNA